MAGFDPRFADLPDYILRITHEIWEGRGLARLHEYYAPDIVVRTPDGASRGNGGVIAATMATLAEFPDRRLLGEDVIWSGTPEAGMLSSHRILSTATHLGEGGFGPPTGRRLVYRAIADCHARANRIDDEWLVRDGGAIVRQMGLSPRDFARTRLARRPAPDGGPLTPRTDPPGPYQGRGNDDEWGARLADLLSRLMEADFAAIARACDPAVQLEHPGGRTLHGHEAAAGAWLALRAAFPDAAFALHHVIGRQDPLMPPRAAVRWSLWGRHAGPGAFGPPTGAQVYVLGITHAEFGPRGLRREWTLFDEVAVWEQILRGAGE